MKANLELGSLCEKVFGASHEGIILTNKDGNIVLTNNVADKIFGFNQEELIGSPIEILIPARFRDMHVNKRQTFERNPSNRVMRGNDFSSDFMSEKKDGSELKLEINLAPIDVGGESYIASIIKDVTHARETQLKQFSRILDNSFDEIYIFDKETLVFLHVNDGAVLNLGYSWDELKTMTPYDIKPDYTKEQFTELIRPLVAETTSRLVFETKHERKDTTLYPVEVRLQISSGFVIAVIMDISSRKHAENALKEKENYLRAIFEATPECVNIVGGDGILFDINQTGLDMLGVTNKSDLIETDFCKFAVPDHQDRIREAFNQALHDHKTNSVEYDIVNMHGTEMSMSTRAVPLYDSDNNAVATLAITRDITERKKQEEQIRHLAFHDTLTNLYNRASFDEHLHRMVANHQRYKDPFGLYVIDLDDFGTINNTLGHPAGDALLEQLAARLSHFFKRDTDFVARYGGDEFVVLIGGLTDCSTDVMKMANKQGRELVDVMKAPYKIGNQMLHVTGSVGLALCLTNSSVTADQVLLRSDQAMYKAKRAGKNQFSIHPVT